MFTIGKKKWGAQTFQVYKKGGVLKKVRKICMYIEHRHSYEHYKY